MLGEPPDCGGSKDTRTKPRAYFSCANQQTTNDIIMVISGACIWCSPVYE